MRRGRLSLVAYGTALWKEMSMPEKTAPAWEEIVTQLTQEQDRFRVGELAHKLNEAGRTWRNFQTLGRLRN